jgi:DNA-binding CsgD family transcriptional regulator
VTAEGGLLVGREREIGAIETLLDGVEGSQTVLIVRGEPGIGKSALLSEASRRAKERGMVVLKTTGVQSEARLPFAGLHQLLWPVHEQIDLLPAPQREAMLAAFGMADTDTPDLFLISMATLNLLSASARSSPVVLIADDTQWLDRSTSEVLAFVARRLDSESIVLLASDRGESESPFESSAPLQLHLGGLDPGSSIALLDRHAAGLAAPVRERLLADAGGNPLALLELPVAWKGLPEGAVPPAWLPLTTRLEHAFQARVLELPAPTRSLLLVAALNDGEALGETLQAGSGTVGSELTLQDVEPAATAGLVEISGATIHFRHPLVRSAIHQAASIAQRHSAHAALAGVLSSQPDRAVWHRAASIIGPDDQVATDLEAAAARAQRRRGTAAALAALERAAQLSTEPTARGRRLLRAAEEASQLGRETAQPRLAASALLVKAQILGFRGERDAAEAVTVEAERAAGPVVPTPLLAWILLARGAAALGRGVPDDAYQHLQRIFDHSDVAYHLMIRSWAFADFAEAAVHSGHNADLRTVIEEMEQLAAATQSSVLRAGLAYARPLVADDRAAEPLFQAGLRTGVAVWPFIRARTQMAYGVWLRRQRRVAESRAPLRAARDEFDALDAPFWADRARHELRATGESSIRHAPELRDELTPQEFQIAHMAAEGLTNREIASKLYLSHRTVSAHLYRVFPKLGITSRSELRNALTPSSS